VSSTEPEKNTIAVAVTDNGCGIKEEDKSKIFQFGFTTKETGHGFGLHTSANTAQAMGGNLTFFNNGSRQGTTFVLTLPYRSDEIT
jgi:signal transduction histidine kinase